MLRRERGRRAATEVYGEGVCNPFRRSQASAKGLQTPSPYCLRAQRIDKFTNGRAAGRVLVERAIRADAVTEGDVEVEEQNFKF